MSETLYRRVGRKYVPVAEWSDAWHNLPIGAHLIVVKPSSSSTVMNIDPAHAPMIAAGTFASDAIISRMVSVDVPMPSGQPLTAEAAECWERFVSLTGPSNRWLRYPSAYDIVQAGIGAMVAESEQMLSNPAVRLAYDRFLMLCELTRTEQ